VPATRIADMDGLHLIHCHSLSCKAKDVRCNFRLADRQGESLNRSADRSAGRLDPGSSVTPTARAMSPGVFRNCAKICILAKIRDVGSAVNSLNEQHLHRLQEH
jgi:hypothetical protein